MTEQLCDSIARSYKAAPQRRNAVARYSEQLSVHIDAMPSASIAHPFQPTAKITKNF